jgi:hypothetical protein
MCFTWRRGQWRVILQKTWVPAKSKPEKYCPMSPFCAIKPLMEIHAMEENKLENEMCEGVKINDLEDALVIWMGQVNAENVKSTREVIKEHVVGT